MEGRGVARFGEVGKFVTDDVVAKLLIEKHAHIGEADTAPGGVAGAECSFAVGYLPLVDPQAETGGQTARPRQEYGRSEPARREMEEAADGGACLRRFHGLRRRDADDEARKVRSGIGGETDVRLCHREMCGTDGDREVVAVDRLPDAVARGRAHGFEICGMALDGLHHMAARGVGGDVDMKLAVDPPGREFA